jgi:sec-independent protein translocase protein TatC
MPGSRQPEMDFFGHLESLRRRVIAALLVFLAAAILFFSLMDRIMPLLTSSAGRMGIKLYVMAPFEKLIAYMKASALLGAAAALPVAASLAGSFVAPALGARARRLIAPAIAIVCLFVLAGAVLAWFVMVPFAVGFFANFSSGDGIEPLWSLGSYISLVSGLVAAMALVCLIPPVLLAFIRAGLLQVSTLAKGRRHAIVAIAIIAAVVTPTVDVVTQCIVGTAMWGLFEITLILGRIIAPSRVPTENRTEAIDGQT